MEGAPPPLKTPVKSIIRGVSIESWNRKLTREPGEGVFLSAANQALLAALILAMVAAAWRRRRLGPQPRTAAALAGAGLVLGLAGVGAYRVAAGERGTAEGAYVALYELSLAALVGAGILATAAPRRAAGSRLDLSLLMALGLAVRLWDLEGNPPRLHAEETAVGLWTRYAAEGRVPELFSTGYFENPVLHLSLDALLMRWLGDGLWAYRATSVPVGLLAAWLTYRLAGELFGGRLAPLLAGAFATFHHVLLYYGRNGIHIVDPALSATAAAYLAVRGLTGGGPGPMLLAGVAAGVGVQGYFPTRIAAVLPFAFAGAALWHPDGVSRRDVGRGVAACVLGLAVALGPLFAYYASAPEALSSREEKVLAFTPAELLRGDPAAWAKLRRNAVLTWRLHGLGRDADPHYGGDAPFAPPLLLPFLLAGAGHAVLSARRRWAQVLLLWIGLTLLLGSLVVNEPRIRRTLSVLPAMGLLSAAGASWASSRPRWRRTAAALALGATAAVAIDHGHLVLVRYPRQKPVDFPSAAGRYLAAHRDEPVQLLTLPELGTSHRFVELLAPGSAARNIRSGAEIAAGTVLVSPHHAPVLRFLLDVPGARLESPWGPPAPAGERMLSEDEGRPLPPCLVHLPAPPGGRAVVELTGDGGRLIARWERTLPFFDFRRQDYPGLRRVAMGLPVAGASPGRVMALSRASPVTLAVDGVVSAGGVTAVPREARGVSATWRVTGDADSFVLVVDAGR